MADNGLLDNNFSRIDLDLDARLGSILSKHEHLISRISSSLQKEATAMGEPSFSYRQNGGQDSIKHAFVVPQGMSDKAQRIIQAQITQILDNAINNLPEGSVNMSSSPTSVKHFNTPINDRQLKASIASLVKYTKGSYSQFNGNSIFSIPTDLQMGDSGSYADIWQHQIATESETFGELSTTDSLMSRAVMESMKSRRRRMRGLRIGYDNSMSMGGQGYSSQGSFFGGSNQIGGSNPLSTHVRGFREQMRFAGSSSTLWGGSGDEPPPPDGTEAPGAGAEKTNLLSNLAQVGTILKGIQALVAKILHFMQNPMTIAEGASGRVLGLSNNDLARFTVAETLNGMAQGTVKSALGDFNSQFGDITNLDEKAITSLALLGGSGETISKTIMTGLEGGSSPKDVFFEVYDTLIKTIRENGGIFSGTGEYKIAEAISPDMVAMISAQLEREKGLAPTTPRKSGRDYWSGGFAGGAALTNDQAQDWQDFEVELNRLKALFANFAEEIRLKLLPVIESFTMGLQNAIYKVSFWMPENEKLAMRQSFAEWNQEKLDALLYQNDQAGQSVMGGYNEITSGDNKSVYEDRIKKLSNSRTANKIKEYLDSHTDADLAIQNLEEDSQLPMMIQDEDLIGIIMSRYLRPYNARTAPNGVLNTDGTWRYGEDFEKYEYLMKRLDRSVAESPNIRLEDNAQLKSLFELQGHSGTGLMKWMLDHGFNPVRNSNNQRALEEAFVPRTNKKEASKTVGGGASDENSKGLDTILANFSPTARGGGNAYLQSFGGNTQGQGTNVYLVIDNKKPVAIYRDGAVVPQNGVTQDNSTAYNVI